MDYSAVSQTAKKFEQESKVNHEMGEIKQKMMVALKENWMSNVEDWILKSHWQFGYLKILDNIITKEIGQFNRIVKIN